MGSGRQPVGAAPLERVLRLEEPRIELQCPVETEAVDAEQEAEGPVEPITEPNKED